MKEMASRRWMCVFMVVALVFSILLGVGPARAALTFWDNFDSSDLIRTDLWGVSSNNSTGGAGVGSTEVISLIDDLLSLAFQVTGTASKLVLGRHFVVNPGGSSAGFDRHEYAVTNPAGKSGIQAKVAMRLCVVQDGSMSARVTGFAFGDGSASSGPGDLKGDIFGLLRLFCPATNQLEITWDVRQCLDSGCNSTNSLGSGSFGPASLNQEYTLHLQRVGNAIVFTVDTLPPQQFVSPSTAPAKGPNWRIGTRLDANFPTSGANLGILASFDDVFVDIP